MAAGGGRALPSSPRVPRLGARGARTPRCIFGWPTGARLLRLPPGRRAAVHLTIDRLNPPLGTLLLVSDVDARVHALEFADHEARMLRLMKAHYGETAVAPGTAPSTVRRALEAYFGGDISAIDDVAVTTGG